MDWPFVHDCTSNGPTLYEDCIGGYYIQVFSIARRIAVIAAVEGTSGEIHTAIERICNVKLYIPLQVERDSDLGYLTLILVGTEENVQRAKQTVLYCAQNLNHRQTELTLRQFVSAVYQRCSRVIASEASQY